MDLLRMLKIIWRWWWIAAAPVLVVGAFSLATYRAPTPTYRITMRFAAGSAAAGASADYDRYYTWLASEYIANGLADMAMTGAFAEAVAGRLAQAGLTVAAPAIQGALVSDNAQSVCVIYLTWGDRAQIEALAQAVTDELTDNGAVYFPQMGGVGAVARRVDTPRVEELRPALKTQLLGPGVRLLLAAAVGLGLAFLTHALDPFARESDDLAALGAPVLAHIPRQR